MSSGALRAAWEAAQSPPSGGGLRAAWESAQGGNDIHAEYASGRLAKRMQRENTNDKEAADAEQITPMEAAGGTLVNLIRDVPGGEAFTTGAHALLHLQSYPKSFQAVRGAEESIPAAVRIPARLTGAAATYRLLPGSNMAKGAISGALSGFTDADPEADRSQEVVERGVTGGLLGAGADVIGAAGSKLGRMIKTQAGKEANVAGRVWRSLPGNKPPVVPSGASVPASAPAASSAGRLVPGRVPGLVGNTPPEVTPGTTPMSINDLLESLTGKLRGAQPHEVGNLIGDAELAMRPHASDNLEDLLRRSLAASQGHPTP